MRNSNTCFKQVPSKFFFCAEKSLTVPDIPGYAESVMELLFKDAESKELEIVGPPEFIYLNTNEDPNTPFQLVIGIPIKESKAINSDFFVWESMPFACLSIDYKGSMLNIGKAWQELVAQVLNEGWQLSNQGREVYKEWVSFESEDNITELQMGVVGKKN